MPRKETQGQQPDEQELQANILADDQDNMDELEENVGVPPRKVTMEEFVGAEKAFDELISTEEREIEKTPFLPGEDTRFVLTERQKEYLEDCIAQFDKYLDYETKRHSYGNREVHIKLKALNEAMKKILDVGLDGLTPEERETVNDYNHIMNDIEAVGDRNLSYHMYNYSGPIGLTLSDIHAGLDMLGVMTGIPATYEGNKAKDLLKGRAEYRKGKVDKVMDSYSEEAQELVANAKTMGIEELQKKFEGTPIADKLKQINAIVIDLSNYKFGNYTIEDDLKAADGLGAFLNQKGENGKSNYDTIVEVLLSQKNGSEKKQAFDALLGQLNTVCDLDIGVPYAIEAQAEHNWDRNETGRINSDLIDDLDKKVFGTLHSHSDEEYLRSIKTLNDMLRDMMRDHIKQNTGNNTRMRGARMGFEAIVHKVENNNGFAKLENTNEKYIHVLDFGKNLHRKQRLDTGEEKTLYELLVRSYEKNGKTKEDLDNTLKNLRDEKKLGLKIRIPGEEAEAEQGKAAPPEQHKPYLNKISEIRRSVRKERDPQKLKMALASVLAMRRMSVDPAHKDHKKIRTKAAMAKALGLMETKAFKKLTENMGVVDLMKKINHAQNFDKDFTEELKKTDLAEYETRLMDEDYKNKIASSATKAADLMDSTGTGVYLMGITRGSNSGMYDRAVLAMRRAAEKKDAAATMQAVQTVKEYLNNKMTPRKSPSGKDRWKYCMEFLHEAMPEKEFEEYCRQINTVRKAPEGSPNHIEAGEFAPKAKRRNSMPADLRKKPKKDTAGQDIAEKPGI